MREELVRACDCRLVTGQAMAVMAAMVEERAGCRLSSLVFDADSAEESRRRSVAVTVKEEELALGSRRGRRESSSRRGAPARG